MGGTRGYRSYRGRTSRGRIALIAVLVLVIAVSVAVIWLQNYVVYDEDGHPHVELPWQEQQSTGQEETPLPPDEVQVTIQEPEGPPRLAALSLPDGPLTLSGWEAATAELAAQPACGAAVISVKDREGHVRFPTDRAPAGAADTAEDTAAALAAAAESGTYTVARVSCFLDPIAAKADVEGMGLKNTGGYIFYDGNDLNWLDPGKTAARQYLLGLAEELAALGFDEILLTDVSYPTVGKLDKIDYGGADRAASIRLFLEEMHDVLEDTGTALSIQLPEEVILSGADEAAGLVLSDIAPLADRICAATTAERIPQMEAAVAAASDTTDFAAELTAYDPSVEGSFVIVSGT